ncbi:MAG: hypothetical protein Q6373_011460 [Candidatus Sigynarchaeota archaeon]
MALEDPIVNRRPKTVRGAAGFLKRLFRFDDIDKILSEMRLL